MSGRRGDFRRKGRSRSKSRSRSRSRSRSPFGRAGRRNPVHTVTSSKHTNSDDPELLRSRVFLGNLPTDKLEREEVSDTFSKYGKILGKFSAFMALITAVIIQNVHVVIPFPDFC